MGGERREKKRGAVIDSFETWYSQKFNWKHLEIHPNTRIHWHVRKHTARFWLFLLCSSWWTNSVRVYSFKITTTLSQMCAVFVKDHIRWATKIWEAVQQNTCSKYYKQELTRQDDHVHSPEDAHDPPHHDDGCQYLDQSRCHVEPEHATNSPLWD